MAAATAGLGQKPPPSLVAGGDRTCSDSGRQSATRNACVEAMLAVLTNKENDHARQRRLGRTRPLEQGQAGRRQAAATKHVWSIRTKLQIADRKRDLAMFNLAIDSKLRGCDVVALKVEDIAPHGYAVERATVRQKKTGVPVRFEVTEQTRQAVDDYIRAVHRKPGDFLFAAPRRPGRGLSTRQYARLVGDWIRGIGLDPCMFGTHSLRRTKATLIYRRTGNLRAAQLLLGHSKIEGTVRYLGIEVDDALAIAEQIDV
jgi:integrase